MYSNDFFEIDRDNRTLWLNLKYRGEATGERHSINDAPLLKALLYLLMEDVFKGEFLGARDKDNIELWQEILTAAARASRHDRSAEVEGRHLTAESFERCLHSGVPMEHPIKGHPPITLFTDPDRRKSGYEFLKYPAMGRSRRTGRMSVYARCTGQTGVSWRSSSTIRTCSPEPIRCCAQLQTVCRSTASPLQLPLASTIRLLDRLLRRDVGLTVEQEVGLLGELLVVRNLCDRLGVADAIAAWRSQGAEEHDFSVFGIDVEVKTTISERRAHWIASLTQLLPTENRPLWLLSHQITRAGADDGRTLRDLIADIRALVGEGETRDGFERRLASAGWADIHERTIRDRWLRRASSLAFQVGRTFLGSLLRC